MPLAKVMDSSSLGALKENIKNMLTDVETYGLIQMEFTVDIPDDDDDCFIEYSEDVVIEDCVDLFKR
jgi:hypothetical protein